MSWIYLKSKDLRWIVGRNHRLYRRRVPERRLSQKVNQVRERKRIDLRVRLLRMRRLVSLNNLTKILNLIINNHWRTRTRKTKKSSNRWT